MPRGKSVYRICEKCNSEISLFGFNKHNKVCNGSSIKRWDKNRKFECICKFCGKEFLTASGRGVHESQCDLNSNKKKPVFSRKKPIWNKGLTKENNSSVLKISNSLLDGYSSGKISRKRRSLTVSEKEHLSFIRSINQSGGFHHVKYFDFEKKDGKKVKLRGSYEVRFAKVLDQAGITWEYAKPIKFKDGNQTRRCMIDFYLPKENLYIDTKGYFAPESRRKYTLIEQQQNIKINIFFLSEIEDCEKDYRTIFKITAHYANSKQDLS
jgi:hypothetical protein